MRLQTREGIERAVRKMQRFAGLKETGILDNATLAVMSKPRCSLPDILGSEDLLRRRRRKRTIRRKKRYVSSGLSWTKTNLTWSVSGSPSLSPHLTPETVQTILSYAFKVWGDATPLNFNMLRPYSNGPAHEADIRVSFASGYHYDGYPFDGAGGTLAHAFFPGMGDIAGDTHFDDEETWSHGDYSGSIDLFTVAVHEFGHALGLSHSSAHHSIMRPFYEGYVGDIRSYTLPADDRLGIQAIYGKRETLHIVPPVAAPTPRFPDPFPPEKTRCFLVMMTEMVKIMMMMVLIMVVMLMMAVVVKVVMIMMMMMMTICPTSPDPSLPDRCQGGFDAIANIRGEIFFFKGPFFWRVQQLGTLMSTSPARIENFWNGLPPRLQKIDAVYERTDGQIIFFIGNQYWMFDGRNSLPSYPRPLADWGIRDVSGRAPESVGAVFVWPHNGKTYLFSKGAFWRFDETEGRRRLESGYPKPVSLWTGMPSEPDDIAILQNGDTCFFKGTFYWVLKRGEMDQETVSQKSIATDWMKCDIRPQENPLKPDWNKEVSQEANVFAILFR
ncbi:matrix metalloproteinase-25-like [Chanos chanos]|uniref:Matrix metalloproteinase-25-like n=1 Tax=Chanos chanos TaxID=29144 RepID=A0A6J2WZL8_CHACN|nr:matrix metalloproteinase-25-like [Chanos chanos]